MHISFRSPFVGTHRIRLFDVQESHLEALASFHETKSKIDMLTGEYAPVAASVFNTNEKE